MRGVGSCFHIHEHRGNGRTCTHEGCPERVRPCGRLCYGDKGWIVVNVHEETMFGTSPTFEVLGPMAYAAVPEA